MQRIVPHLWYDTQALEAAEFYVSVFGGDSRIINKFSIENTPSGTTESVIFELLGFRFNAISAGPLFAFNPSISFIVKCADFHEVDEIWNNLSEGGKVLMPLDNYPFSRRYGWAQDKYGLSWQIMYAGEEQITERIIPALMFTENNAGEAEEAMQFYTSIFADSSYEVISRHEGKLPRRKTGKDDPEQDEAVAYGDMVLEGIRFGVMDSDYDHGFTFNEAVSLMIKCFRQSEIDRFWKKLSAVPEAEQCGWLKDQYGLSWQVVPTILNEFLSNGTDEQRQRVTETFLQMKKFNISELEAAYGKEVKTGQEH